MYHIIWTGNILQYIPMQSEQNYVSYNLNWKYSAIYSYAIIAKLCIIYFELEIYCNIFLSNNSKIMYHIIWTGNILQYIPMQ